VSQNKGWHSRTNNRGSAQQVLRWKTRSKREQAQIDRGRGTDGGDAAPYKLHISIPQKFYPKIQNKIDTLLKGYVATGDIRGFKFRDKEPRNTRVMNNPFTIYLCNDSKPERIGSMIAEIEMLLDKNNVHISEKEKHLSDADVPITNHVSLRQEEDSYGNYVSIRKADSETLKLLRKKALSLQLYQDLVIVNGQLAEKKQGESISPDSCFLHFLPIVCVVRVCAT